MKNTWNIRKKDDAVSPVIATILMVAITVVLAAVLYVMVIGFGGGGDTTPAGAWSASDASAVDAGTVKFGLFSVDTAPLDLKIFMYQNGTQVTTLTWTSNTATSPAALTLNPAAGVGTALTLPNLDADYYDLNAAGGLINSGDYIEFDGLNPGSTYTFTVFHTPTDAEVSMTGDDGKIITP